MENRRKLGKILFLIFIGKGAVGLYSSDATKFSNTFKVVSGKSLEIVLGQNSTFGLLSGAAGTVNVGTYLKNNTLNISTFGSGASIFYTTGGVTANLNENYTVTNGEAASTAVLVGANGFSTPSATTYMPMPWPSAMMARAMAMLSDPSPASDRNERSIFSVRGLKLLR